MLGTRTRLQLHNAVEQYQHAAHTLKQAQMPRECADRMLTEPVTVSVWPQRLVLIALAAIVCGVFAVVMP